jgi:hypothetical protein
MDQAAKPQKPRRRSALWLAIGVALVFGGIRGLLDTGSGSHIPNTEAQGQEAASLVFLLVGAGLIMFWINSLVQERKK